MPTTNIPPSVGLYVPTTSVWDQANIANIDINSDAGKELLVKLYQNINNIAVALNYKDSALYDVQEFVSGQMFFSNTPQNRSILRNAYRLTMNLGAIANGVTLTVAHNLPIGTTWTFSRIYGAATDNIGLNYYPIPFAGAGGTYISINVTSTNVVITNNSGVSFTSIIVVLEYLKN